MPAKFSYDHANAPRLTEPQGAWPMVESAMPPAPAWHRSSEDREMARALVDAGYMPVADYIELYGDDPAQAEAAVMPMSVSARFPVAFARRQTYRATSVRCTFAKPSARLTRWERRA